MNKIKGLFRTFKSSEFYQLSKELFVLLIPLLGISFLQFAINVTPIMFVGHLDRVQLDGVSFSMSIIHIFGTSIGYGLGFACDTMFSQAFGSPDKTSTGMYLQKNLYISLLFPFPIAAVLLNIGHLFPLLGQDPRICKIASVYIATYLPGLPVQYGYYIISKYMQNQDKMWPSFISVLVGNIFNVVSHYLVIYQWQYGYQASAICMVLTYVIMLTINVLYLITSGFYKSTWPGWTGAALYDWKDFLKLAIPGIAHATVEQINWEAEIFMTGILGIVPMAVHSVLAQTGTLTCPIYYAVSISTNVRIGQYMGANQPKKAKQLVKVAIVIMILFTSVLSLFIMLMSNLWPKLFTSDKLVNDQVSEILPFFPIYFFPESIAGVLAGVLRGCAKQALGMYLALACMYLIGLPLAATLGFLTQLQVGGMWIGNSIGLTVLMIAFFIAIRFFNWEDMAINIKHRLQGSHYDDNSENLEENPLLKSTDNEIKIEISTKSPYQVGHMRMPSHGITCSADLFELKKSIKFDRIRLKTRLSTNKKLILLQKLMILLICISILVIGVILHFTFVPNFAITETSLAPLNFNTTYSILRRK